MTYCFYREKKPKGRCLTGTIDYNKANQMIAVFQNVRLGSDDRPTPESLSSMLLLEPNNGCSYSFLNQTKCALKELWQEQWDLCKNTFGKQEVFGNYTKFLLKRATK